MTIAGGGSDPTLAVAAVARHYSGMATEKSKRVQVGVTMSASVPVPPPEAANFFHLTVVGPEIQLLVGSVNLLRFHEAKDKGEMTLVTPEISHRFLLSTLGFA